MADSESAIDTHSKYSQLPGAFTGNFGDASAFFKGLDHILGLPNPNVSASIALEHQASSDSQDEFVPNASVGVAYKPFIEYEFVVHPDLNNTQLYPGTSGPPGTAAGGGSRRPTPLSEFISNNLCQSANLLDEEVIALRLYTGPMFFKYNAVLRNFPENAVKALKGNRYVTTIHAIVSGVIKLSQYMILPENRKVLAIYFVFHHFVLFKFPKFGRFTGALEACYFRISSGVLMLLVAEEGSSTACFLRRLTGRCP